MPDRDRPAALIASRLVKAGHEPEFDRWAERLVDEVGRSDGHRSTARLDQPGGLAHFVHHFASEDAMTRWADSPERRALTRDAEPFSVGCRQTAAGERFSVRLPSESAAPKWKLWLATWLAVFPILLTLNAAMRALPVELPQPVQLGITSLIMTGALTWFVIPRIRALLRPWLLRGEDGALRRDAD